MPKKTIASIRDSYGDFCVKHAVLCHHPDDHITVYPHTYDSAIAANIAMRELRHAEGVNKDCMFSVLPFVMPRMRGRLAG